MLVGGTEGVGLLAASSYVRQLLLKPLGFRAASLIRYAQSSAAGTRRSAADAAASALAALNSTARSGQPAEAGGEMPAQDDVCGAPTEDEQAESTGMALYRAVSLLADAL